MTITEKIEDFKQVLVKRQLTQEEIFQRFIVDGNTFFFSSYIGNTSQEYKTKTIIADFFGIHIHEIVFVGSCKLGFSLNPKNTFNEFDSKFRTTKDKRDKSDIDIAIISNALFENINRTLFEFTDSFKKKWYKNEYYYGDKLKEFDVPICYKYFEYFSKGWFRPDMRPQGYDFCRKSSYEILKRELYQTYKRKVAIAIYKDWYYFKDYHMNNLNKLYYKVKTDTV